ncbi:hypothetical protein QBC32DRAFT_9276 [Pseudoneurospora amorphoporcata]|uniref:F-box domain-containing protein n=1 Tax=Pseudoneurospora amorphoporcata TaxID=241081 RepID=A0AAN6P5E8_9PEZI|nr:hypothetical protein QBC32DRAFT_9276 [Pseudoneurospora amorphoporcata]
MRSFLPHDVLYQIIHHFCLLHFPNRHEVLDPNFLADTSVQQLLQLRLISRAFYHAVTPHILNHVPLTFREVDRWPQSLRYWSSEETKHLRAKVRKLEVIMRAYWNAKHYLDTNNASMGQALAVSATKERQLRQWTTDLRNQLELPMVGLPSLRELILSFTSTIWTTIMYNDDLLFNRAAQDLVSETARYFGSALSDGRFDQLTSLKVKASTNQLSEILLGAARSKRLCMNLKSFDVDNFEAQYGWDEADEAVQVLVERCPNLKELFLFSVRRKIRLHPENTGLEKLVVGRVSVSRWKPLTYLENLVVSNTAVRLEDLRFCYRPHNAQSSGSFWHGPEGLGEPDDYNMLQKQLKCRSLQVIKIGEIVFPEPTTLGLFRPGFLEWIERRHVG